MEEQPETQVRTYYTPAMKKAIMTYREKNVEKYNEFQRNYYHSRKIDEEWNEKFKERCREANRRYRERKKENAPPAKIGRPRKVPVQEV